MIINNKQIKEALSSCKVVTSGYTSIPVHKMVLVNINENIITLNSFNHNVYFKKEIEIINTDKNSGKFLLSIEKFYEVLSSIPDEEVTIDLKLDKSTIVLKGEKTRQSVRVNTTDIKNFPAMDKEKPKATIITNSEKLDRYIKNTFKTVGTRSTVTDQNFLCIFLIPEKKDEIVTLKIASSDRRRVSGNRLVVDLMGEGQDFEGYYGLNPSSLKVYLSASNTSPNDSETTIISFTENSVIFNKDNTTIQILVSSDSFVDYEMIIPKAFDYAFKFSRKEMEIALKQSLILAKEDLVNNSISLTLKASRSIINIESTNDKGESISSDINIIDYTGNQNETTLFFNANYLLSFISAFQEDFLYWKGLNPSNIEPTEKRKKAKTNTITTQDFADNKVPDEFYTTNSI